MSKVAEDDKSVDSANRAIDSDSPADNPDTHFLSILPYGLKPQFDTTGWVPHGSILHAPVTSPINESVTGGVGSAKAKAKSNFSFDYKSSRDTLEPKPKGAIKLVKDFEVKSLTAELTTTGDSRKTFVAFPEMATPITPLPLLIIHIKNLNRKVCIEVDVQVVGEKRIRTLSFNNAQSVVRLMADVCSVPLRLRDGWNKLALDLNALTARVFAATFRHTVRVRVYAHCRLRRLYFSDRLYSDAELPNALKVMPPKD